MNDGREPVILVCDDDMFNRKLIAAMLIDLPYRIEEVSCGRDAIAAVLSNHASFDLVLLDISMKEINGIEVCQAIRKYENNLKRPLPIVAYTASAMLDEREQYFSVGFNEILTKPTSRANLMHIINTYIGVNYVSLETQ